EDQAWGGGHRLTLVAVALAGVASTSSGEGVERSCCSVSRVTSAPTRPASAVDEIATDFFDRAVQNSPMEATYLGIPIRQDELDDLSPAGLEEDSALRQET